MRAGYRDRLLTELAQNAADAAARGGAAGELRVWLDDGVLHVANNGEPLDSAGVQALAALRASNKVQGVGRYGVGFTAVRSVSDEIELRSTSGSILFSAERTREHLGAAGLVAPEVGAPVLRLVWPSPNVPVPRAASEVVLRLRPGIDGAALLAQLTSEATDLLLELPALECIRVAEHEFHRRSRRLDRGLTELGIGNRVWWEHRTPGARWLVPVVDGVVAPVHEDVLRAPTRSDEALSIPAVLIAEIALQPDRRRLLPGAPVAPLAKGYADLVAALPPAQRLAMVPVPGFARSEVDSILREHLLAELREAPWLPSADGGPDLPPVRATVLPGLTDDLAELLGEIVPGLISPELSDPRHATALDAVDAHRIGLARIAELLSGIKREPAWWRRFYAALEPLVVDALDTEELAAIPVPLSDGRTVTGPRTTVIGSDLGSGPLALDWVRLVHPEAAHPLLTRLGAGHASAADLLSDPALLAAIEDVDYADETAAAALAAVVLGLAAHATPDALPTWLGQLLLPDEHGELIPADELLLPGAPLATVLAPDSPFATVDADVVQRYGAAVLRTVGVGWGFTVLRAELPTGPEHHLDDEGSWWSTLAEDPYLLVAVRDLDLVDSGRWPEALTLLARDPATRAALSDRDGYTAWWLRMHARVDGQQLGHLRAPGNDTFVGLLDVLEHPAVEHLAATLAPRTVDSPELAQLLMDRLEDPTRDPSAAVTTRTHSLLADAAAAGVLDLEELQLPGRVRALSGALVDPVSALVLDRPWFGDAVPSDRLVVGNIAHADALADVLDVPLASAAVHVEVVGHGRSSSWPREPGAVLASVALGRELPDGPLVMHDRLTIRRSGAVEGEIDVPCWVDEDGVTHCTGTQWAAACAWAPSRERRRGD